MSQPESRLSRAISTAVRAHGGFIFKVHGGPMTMAGIPDLVGVVDGRSIWLETKMPGGKPSPIQLLRHEQIMAAGGNVYVPTSVSEAMEWIAMVRGTPAT